MSGTVTVTNPTVLAELRSDPGSFYTDLHTRKFPDGAVRAQFHLLNHAVTTTGVAVLQESVIFGSQIYACTQQSDGSFAFTQHDVEGASAAVSTTPSCSPTLARRGGKRPTRTAHGKVATRNDNGAGNIAELDLDATQIGKSTGLLGDVVEVLRLNTVGGVAPAGACDPQATPIVNVRYQADYVFING